MFLEKSPEKLTRRTRIERWLLLALRCLALLALALVFGRPFLKSTTLPSELPNSSIAVILVDRGASMQREDLAQRALKAAEKAIQDRKAEDEVAAFLFDRDTEELAGFADWKSLDGRARAGDFKNRASRLESGWDVSNPGRALFEAADAIVAQSADKEYLNREIILISDFIEGADFDALNQFAWPEDITVQCIRLAPKKPGNISLTVAATSAESRSAAEVTHRVRIANAAESDFEKFTLSWQGDPDSKIEGVVPPGASRIVKVPNTSKSENSGKLIVTGDDHPFDNTVYISPPSPLPMPIMFFSSEENPDQVGSPGFYLKRALHPTASLIPTMESAPFSEFDGALENATALVIHGNWTEEIAKKAHEAATEGKLVIALPDSGTTNKALGNLLGIPGVQLQENQDDKYAMLADLDFEHPVLAPFARARIRDFTKIRFWKYRRLQLPEEIPADVAVLAEFDSKTPAWVSRTVGKGSIFVFLSSWEPDESQFALSSKFVPVLYSIFENAGYSAKSAPTYYVGDVQILKEGKMEVASSPGLFPGKQLNDTNTLIGVNLHPSTGRVDPIDPNHVLSGFSIPLKATSDAKIKELPTDAIKKKRLESEEKEASQKLWKWLVIAVLLFLIAETWLSGRRPSQKSTIAPA